MTLLPPSAAAGAVCIELVDEPVLALSIDELDARLSRFDRATIFDAAEELRCLGLAHALGGELYCASFSARAAAAVLGQG